MTMNDIFSFINAIRPNMDQERLWGLYEEAIYHLEEKIRQEVLHLDVKFDHKNLALPTPYDDVYWTYIMSMIHLEDGRIEVYREYRKQFEEAWENLCRQVFLQKEAFRLAPWFPNGEEGT